jgi:ankyrin repeat protein
MHYWQQGQNVDAATRIGLTALHVAATEGHTACLSLLIAAHANLEATESIQQMTALHYAAAFGHLPAIRCLVAAGANLGVQDKEGRTPLHIATSWGQAACVRELLAAGPTLKWVP